MAPGPIRALRYVHEAIRAQAQLVEDRLAAADSPAAVADIVADVRVLTEAVRGHVAGEDKGYFPAVAARAEHAAASFQFDHDAEHERLDELDRLAPKCQSSEQLTALRRASVVVREHLHLHMLKEEELLWPLTEELFSPEEQGQLVQAILAAIPKEQFPQLIPWIVNMVGDDDAVAYVQTLQRVQPPEVFAKSCEWIRESVRADRLGVLSCQIEALA